MIVPADPPAVPVSDDSYPKGRAALTKALAGKKQLPDPEALRTDPTLQLEPDVRALMRARTGLERVLRDRNRPVQTKYKLTDRGLHILGRVKSGDDRPGKLIDYLGIVPSAITAETDKLVGAGLLARERVASDRRGVKLRLTEAGAKVLRESIEVTNSFLRPRLARLTREQLNLFLLAFAVLADPEAPAEIAPAPAVRATKPPARAAE